MHRRTFLQSLVSLPALAWLRPSRQVEPTPIKPMYSDSDGNSASLLLAMLTDNNLMTGVEYQP